MSSEVLIHLKRPSKTFSRGDYIEGSVEVKVKNGFKHDGVYLTLQGIASTHAGQKGSIMDAMAANSTRVRAHLHMTKNL